MIRNKRKKKLVMLGVLSLASISLISIGLSTWISGVVIDNDTVSATISIEGSVTQVITVEGTTNKESIKVDSDSDMSVPTTYTVITSQNATFNALNVSMSAVSKDSTIEESSDINTSIPVLDESKTSSDGTDIFGRNYSDTSYSSLTYLTLSKTKYESIELKKETYLDDYYSYTLKDTTFAIKFGSFFNNENPQTFYDTKLAEYKNAYLNATSDNKASARETYLKAISAANKELNQMHDLLDGSTIKIKLTADYSFAS